jgi:alcohol dehydrogenase class IV
MFEFATATRIVFGPGAIASVPELVASLAAPGRTAERGGSGGGEVLVLSGKEPQRAEPLVLALRSLGFSVARLPVREEPSVTQVRAWVGAARDVGAGAVISIGGGSVIDAGKATAILAGNPGDPLDYLEVVGRGQPLDQPGLPFVAIPTTAGTGAEVTRNAVLTVDGAGVKASLRSPHMLPRLAVVDPDLLASAPATVIAHSGLDALSQLIEPWLSVRANPVTDALAREGIRRSARALRAAFIEGLGGRPELREDLALASLLGGMCLANAGLGVVHGFAAPAGGMLGAPHGAICAALLPHVLAVNLRALRQRVPTHPALPRFRELAALLTGRPIEAVDANEGVTWVAELCRDLGIRGLGHLGLGRAQIPELVAKTRAASSTKGNPLALLDAELEEIASRAL